MVDVSLDQDANRQAASPSQRLIEARWLLIALGIVFLLFYSQWENSGGLLVLAYLFLVGVISFSPRRQNRIVATPRPVRTRPIWPATQAKLFVDAIPEPSVVLDGEGIVRHTNALMRDVFGSLSQGDPLTLKFRDPDIVDALARVQRTGQSASVHHMLRFPTERRFLVYFSPIILPGSGTKSNVPTSGSYGPDFILLVMLEQTEQFRTEEMRSDFIANVSHELRTPVASLTGFIETLLGPAKDDEVSRERFLHIMLEQAQRMTRLVNDLLSLSRIEMRSHLKPRDKVDLAHVVHHVVDAMMPLAQEEELQIMVEADDGPLPVMGEEDELIQVVQNLVENACKYGVGGEKVEISVGETRPPKDFGEKVDSCYVVKVKDFGKGIPAEHLPRLTERFYRIDAEESKRKMGTGLGLAVVKHILARHDTELRIASVEGEGAEFSFYMTAFTESD